MSDEQELNEARTASLDEQVLRLVRDGFDAERIAGKTGLAVTTVKKKIKMLKDRGESFFPVMSLPLNTIRVDWSINPRHQRDSEGVARYSDAYRRGEKLPVLTVFYDGTDHWLSRGFHRHAGATDAGLKELEFEVRPGGREDALRHAVTDNAAHGIPRSRDDLAKAVELALADPELSLLSNRELGRLIRCSEWVFRRRRPESQQQPESDTTEETPPDEPERPAATDPEPQVRSERTSDPEPPTPPVQQPAPVPAVLPAASQSSSPAEPPPTVHPRDKLGRVLPPFLVAVFEQGDKFEATAAKFGSAAADLKRIDADEVVGGFLRTRPHLEGDARDLARFVRRHLSPFAVCPACSGDGDSELCPSCGGRGWVTRAGFEQLAPEMKQLARSHAPGDAWEGDEPDEQPAADSAARYVPKGPGLDPLGTKIPNELRDLFAADYLWEIAHRFERALTALNGAKSWLHWLKPETLEAVANAARGVRDSIPFAVCKKCRGEGCEKCMTAGYVPEWFHASEQAKKGK